MFILFYDFIILHYFKKNILFTLNFENIILIHLYLFFVLYI